jgi:quercetin dioxygenase-like cupin family protein
MLMTSSMFPVISFGDLPWETTVPGVRSKSVVRDGQRLRLVEFFSEFVEPDWCTKSHIGYVVEGELEINCNGIVQRVRAGNGLFIPDGGEFKHRARIVGSRAVLVLVERA